MSSPPVSTEYFCPSLPPSQVIQNGVASARNPVPDEPSLLCLPFGGNGVIMPNSLEARDTTALGVYTHPDVITTPILPGPAPQRRPESACKTRGSAGGGVGTAPLAQVADGAAPSPARQSPVKRFFKRVKRLFCCTASVDEAASSVGSAITLPGMHCVIVVEGEGVAEVMHAEDWMMQWVAISYR